MEKGGLSAQLTAIGCTDSDGLYWGDEMRVGLIGQVRRVWAPRGVKVVQVVAYQRVWAYLNLAVYGVTGQVRWGWTENMKGVSIDVDPRSCTMLTRIYCDPRDLILRLQKAAVVGLWAVWGAGPSPVSAAHRYQKKRISGPLMDRPARGSESD